MTSAPTRKRKKRKNGGTREEGVEMSREKWNRILNVNVMLVPKVCVCTIKCGTSSTVVDEEK